MSQIENQEHGSEYAPVPLPHNEVRRSDVSPKQAKYQQRLISLLFGLSMLCAVIFVVSYVQIPIDDTIAIPFLGTWSKMNTILGLSFGLGSFFIGAGVIQWAKQLMSHREMVQSRHPLRSPDDAREDAVAQFKQGVQESTFATQPILRRSLIGAMALFPIPLVMLLRDLGPLPGDKLFNTMWRPGMRVVMDVTSAPIKPEEIPIGGIVSAMPDGLPEVQEHEGNLNERAKSVVLLVRLNPDDIVSQQNPEGEPSWDYEGVLCFSKICTHVGCPIALYEQRTHHLLCPCHQSTFDLADSGRVVFGPAARDLPQLPITVDSEGYIIARNGFAEPVGPSFWERA